MRLHENRHKVSSRSFTILALLTLAGSACYGPAQRNQRPPPTIVGPHADYLSPLVVRYEPRLDSDSLHLKSIVARLDHRDSSRLEGLAPAGAHQVDIEVTFSKDSFAAFGQEDSRPFASWAHSWTVELPKARQIVVVLVVNERQGGNVQNKLQTRAFLEFHNEEGPPVAVDSPYPPLVFYDRPEPLLADSLLRLRIDLTNIVKVCVDERGSVNALTLLRASNPVYDGAWLDAVSRWKAHPVIFKGKPVRMCTRTRYDLKHEAFDRHLTRRNPNDLPRSTTEGDGH